MLAQATINGLLLGGLYGLATVGFSMVWGVMGVINLAHTSFIMIGAYVTLLLHTQFGLDPLLSIPLSMLVLFAVGYALQITVIDRILRISLLLSLVVTFGVDLAIVDLFRLMFSADLRAVNTPYAQSSISLFGVLIPLVRLVIAGFSLLLGGALALFLRLTNAGQSILATALDREVASLMGIDPRRVYALTAGVGAALAGSTGSLASMIFPVTPTMGGIFLGGAFVVTVLGGIGSVEGCIVGGFLYGLTQSLAAFWLGASYQNLVAFALFLLVLLVRPQGLFGRAFFGLAT
jgi:branched-chain amino acid transport system permease protein